MTTDASSTFDSDDTVLEAEDELVPGWLQRIAAIGWRVLVALALGVVLIFIAIQLQAVTAAIVIGLIVSATFAPAVRRLRTGRGYGRTKAAIVVSGVALLALVVVIGLLVYAFAPYVDDLLAGIQAGVTQVKDWLDEASVSPAVSEAIDHAVQTFQQVASTAVSDLVGPISVLVTAMILGAFLTFFLLQDGDRAWAAVTSGIDPWRAQALTERGMVALERVGGYLRGTAIMASTDMISDFVYLTILGVPLAAPLSVLVFLGGFIPYLGGFVTTSIMLLVTVSTVGVTPAIILIILIVITNLFQGNLLAPQVYGRTVEIHPALVLMALPAGFALFGIIGLFAALPIVAFVLAIAPAIVSALDTNPAKLTQRGLVPTWLDRLGQWSWRLLVLIAILGVAIRLAVAVPLVIVPVVLATVFAATLDPVVDRLKARGFTDGRAALLVTTLSVVVVVGVVTLTLISLVGSASEMVDTSLVATAKLDIGQSAIDVVQSFGSGMLGTLVSVVSQFGSFAVALLLATLLTFYFLRDGKKLWAKVLARTDGTQHEKLAVAGPRAASILNGYMVGTGVISIFGAVTQWLIMVILGLPLALPIGVLSFFGGFIPYIGSAITTLLGFLVAVAFGTPEQVVIMFIYTIVFNIVQGNFVAPLVYGKAVSLHPAIVLLAIPAGGAVAGVLGMFLVVPFLGVFAATWRTTVHLFDPASERRVEAALAAADDPPPALSADSLPATPA